MTDADAIRRQLTSISNALNFTQDHMKLVIAYSLAELYDGILKEPLPDSLRTIVNRLDSD